MVYIELFYEAWLPGLLPPRSEEDAAGSNDDQPDVPRRTKVFYVNNTRYEFEY